MYSFAQRLDTRVYDEPLYAHYLSTTDARSYHPGADDVIAAQENDGARVVSDLLLGPSDRPVLFFKNMTHHLVGLDWSFLTQLTNVLLTREPAAVIASYAKNIHDVTMRDTGFADQSALLDYLEAHGQTPPILDSQEVLKNPRAVLRQLCERIGIAFDEVMLTWPAGPRAEDGVWAKYWYANVHASTGFLPSAASTPTVPDHLQPLLAACQPHYERLAALAIRA
ncbi:MAG: sulfotransferase family protein [Caldilineaceae bacterium]|nr:sulfotransferase family protein [Caldilineaceae bacterium]